MNAFLAKHNTHQYKSITMADSNEVEYVKVCTGSLSDSDIAAIFFACSFILLAAVVAGYVWWKISNKKAQQYNSGAVNY